jgi:hypothetical protein
MMGETGLDARCIPSRHWYKWPVWVDLCRLMLHCTRWLTARSGRNVLEATRRTRAEPRLNRHCLEPTGYGLSVHFVGLLRWRCAANGRQEAE